MEAKTKPAKKYLLEFSKQDELSEHVKNLIKDEIKRRNFAKYNELVTSCNITECDRRLLYRSMGTKPETHGDTMEILSREAAKTKWLDFFEKSIKVDLKDRKLVVADEDYDINGCADGVIKIGDLLAALLIKPVPEETFKELSMGALRKDVIELMSYIWLLELQHGILIYENKNNDDFCVYHVTKYQPMIDAIKAKGKKIMSLRLHGMMVERPYKKREKECLVCEFNGKCWKEKGEK